MRNDSAGKPAGSKTLHGRGLSPGKAIGTAYRVAPIRGGFFPIHIQPEGAAEELKRLKTALGASLHQLHNVRDRLEAQVGREQSCIVDAHLLILEDRHFLQGIEKRILDSLESAEQATRATVESWLRLYRSLQDPFFRERGSDLEEVAERLIANLGQLQPSKPHNLPRDLVLVAERISLLAVAEFRLDRIRGLLLNQGGRHSHLNIIARSCQIPVVAGIERVTEWVQSGDVVLVDGDQGLAQVRPSLEDQKSFSIQVRQQHQRSLLESDPAACRTLDGRRIHIFANTEVGTEVGLGLQMGGEGIGLFRSESIYLEDREAPAGEERQYSVYRELAQMVGEQKAIIRTLDIGDEDHPYFSKLAGMAPPVLGLRGIRMSLRYPEIFRTQVRAILRARRHGSLDIALPMVSGLEEIRQARQLIRKVQHELGPPPNGKPAEVGIMLEVPAALLVLPALLEESDFVLVGSNDLIQFTLAVGRTDEKASDLYNPLHPAILRSLARIAEACNQAGKPAIVCGEIASQPDFASLLVGMGFQSLSMSPFAIPVIKRHLRRLRFETLRQGAVSLTGLSTIEEIETAFREFFEPEGARGGEAREKDTKTFAKFR